MPPSERMDAVVQARIEGVDRFLADTRRMAQALSDVTRAAQSRGGAGASPSLSASGTVQLPGLSKQAQDLGGSKLANELALTQTQLAQYRAKLKEVDAQFERIRASGREVPEAFVKARQELATMASVGGSVGAALRTFEREEQRAIKATKDLADAQAARVAAAASPARRPVEEITGASSPTARANARLAQAQNKYADSVEKRLLASSIASREPTVENASRLRAALATEQTALQRIASAEDAVAKAREEQAASLRRDVAAAASPERARIPGLGTDATEAQKADHKLALALNKRAEAEEKRILAASDASRPGAGRDEQARLRAAVAAEETARRGVVDATQALRKAVEDETQTHLRAAEAEARLANGSGIRGLPADASLQEVHRQKVEVATAALALARDKQARIAEAAARGEKGTTEALRSADLSVARAETALRNAYTVAARSVHDEAKRAEQAASPIRVPGELNIPQVTSASTPTEFANRGLAVAQAKYASATEAASNARSAAAAGDRAAADKLRSLQFAEESARQAVVTAERRLESARKQEADAAALAARTDTGSRLNRTAQQFRLGFSGVSEVPYAQQLGQAFKFSAFYGTAYKLQFALIQVFQQALQEGIEFQQALTDLKIATGRSDEEINKLADNLGKSAAEAGASPGQGVQIGARSLGLYGLAGSSDAQEQERVAQLSARVVSRLAVGSKQQPVDLQNSIAAITASLGLGATGQIRVADLDAYLTKRFGVAQGSTFDAVSQSSAVGKSAGFTNEQLFAIAADLQARTGQSSTAVGGYLAQIFSRTGEGALTNVTSKYGIDQSESLAKQLEQLAKIYQGASGSEQNQIQAAFGRGKVQNAVTALLEDYGKVLTESQAAKTGASGAADAQFEARMADIGGQINDLTGDMKQLAHELGESGLLDGIGLLVKVTDSGVESLNNLFSLFNELPRPIRDVIGGLALLAAGLKVAGVEGGLRGVGNTVLARAATGATREAALARQAALTGSAVLYHGGLPLGSKVSDIDPNRIGTQQGRGKYGGFYLTDSSSKQWSEQYAQQRNGNLSTFYMKPDARLKDLGDRNIDRMAQAERTALAREADYVKGKDVLGRSQYLLLNPGAVQQMENTNLNNAAQREAGAHRAPTRLTNAVASAEQNAAGRALLAGTRGAATGLRSIAGLGAAAARTIGPMGGAIIGLLAISSMRAASEKYRNAADLAADQIRSGPGYGGTASQYRGQADALVSNRKQIKESQDGFGAFLNKLNTLGQSNNGAAKDEAALSAQIESLRALANRIDKEAADAPAPRARAFQSLGKDDISTGLDAISSRGGTASTQLNALARAINGVGDVAGSKAADIDRPRLGVDIAGALTKGIGKENSTAFGSEFIARFGVGLLNDNTAIAPSDLNSTIGPLIQKRLKKALAKYGVESFDQLDKDTAEKVAADLATTGDVQDSVRDGQNISGGKIKSIRDEVRKNIVKALLKNADDAKEVLGGSSLLSSDQAVAALSALQDAAQGARDALPETDFKGRIAQAKSVLQTTLALNARSGGDIPAVQQAIRQARTDLAQSQIDQLEALRKAQVANSSSQGAATAAGRRAVNQEIKIAVKSGNSDLLLQVLSTAGKGAIAIARKTVNDALVAAKRAEQVQRQIRAAMAAANGALAGVFGGLGIALQLKDQALGTQSSKELQGLQDSLQYAVPDASPDQVPGLKDTAAKEKDSKAQIAAARRAAEAARNGGAIASAQAGVAQARADMADAKKGTVAYYNALASYYSARSQLDDALREYSTNRRKLASDLSDPVAQAQIELQAALQKLRTDRSRGRGKDVLAQDQVDVRQAQLSAEQAKFDQRLSDVQTAEQLGRISHQAYIRYLEREHDRLSAIGKRTRQQQDQLNQIDGLLKDASQELAGQFNIGDIKLPTPYQIRRYVQEQAQVIGTPGLEADGQTVAGRPGNFRSGTTTIYIDGADTAKVKEIINDTVGKSSRVVTSAGRRNT